MGNLGIIFKRELNGYFATPLAYVFIVIFLITNGIFTFDLGGFFLRGGVRQISCHFSAFIPGSISSWSQQLR